MHEIFVPVIAVFAGIATITVDMASVFDHTALAQAETTGRAHGYSLSARMKVAFQWTHPLLKRAIGQTDTHSETQLIPNFQVVKWNIGCNMRGPHRSP
jgi:hypothetical protein